MASRAKEKEKRSFKVYFSLEKQLRRLSDEEAGKLIKAMLQHAENVWNGIDDPEREEQEIRERFGFEDGDRTDLVYLGVADQIERDTERYRQTCETNQQTAERRETEKRAAAEAEDVIRLWETLSDNKGLGRYESAWKDRVIKLVLLRGQNDVMNAFTVVLKWDDDDRKLFTIDKLESLLGA